VIVEEQADGGRTVIEKFEKQALDVGFAVALLTADDMGSVAGSETPKLANRARQNGFWSSATSWAHLAARGLSHSAPAPWNARATFMGCSTSAGLQKESRLAFVCGTQSSGGDVMLPAGDQRRRRPACG
jgi:hypothetical protein